jgi:putative Ca2+/H+ antiporter (TMEM165/GDT1 family)
MEALLPSFIAAAFAEFGDKTQLLVIAMLAATRRPGPILAGLIASSLIGSLAMAFAGTLMHDMMPLRATALFLAIALLYAGGAGLWGVRKPNAFEPGNTPLFLASFLLLLAGELGDKTQFLAAGMAARFDSAVGVGLAIAAGTLAANAPVFLLGKQYEAVPVRAIRIGAGALFLLAGAVVALGALRLI